MTRGLARRPIKTVMSTVPCYRCGGLERLTSTRGCVVCAREVSRNYNRRLRAENPEKRREMHRAWRKSKGEHLKAYDRRAGLLRNFGIGIDEYEAMLVAQNGVCAICEGIELSGKRLAVDHNAKTGKIRGLLCGNCNRAIGQLKDSPAICIAAAGYLQRSGENG